MKKNLNAVMQNYLCNQTENAIAQYLKRIAMISLTLLLTAGAYSQSTRYSVEFTNQSLEQALKIIQKETGYTYLLNHEEIPQNTNISLKITNVAIEEIIKACLKGLPLDYQIKNKVIVIVPKKPENQIQQVTELYQTIRGKISDSESGVSLPGANIIVLESNPLIGSVSDEEGNFRLQKVPVGRHNLRVSYVGYQEIVIPEILVGSAKEVILNLKLKEKASDIEEITVRPYAKGEPKNDMATVSARSFSVEESQRIAGSAGDPGRMALSFPGVNTSDDASNQMVIRGNAPESMLWRLEGTQIPIPNHFAMEGWDAGYVSMLNPKMLGPSDFYTGAFPAEYGNATSGVFDLSFRNGNNEKRENSFEFGVLGVDLTTEGPFSKNYKGSYLVNYRYATFSLMNLLGIRISGDLLPEYTDLSFKLYLPTKKLGTFSVWGMGGTGLVEDDATKDTVLWDSMPYTRYSYKTQTKMLASGITHIFFPDNKSYFKSLISFSGSSSVDESYYLMKDFSAIPTYNELLSSSAVRVSSLYNRKLSSGITLRTGLVYSALFYQYLSKYVEEEIDPTVWYEDIKGDGNSSSAQGFLQFKMNPIKNLSINAGLHSMYLHLTKEHTIEPRAGFQLKLPHQQSINGGYGIHSQHGYLMTYFILIPDSTGNVQYRNKNLKLQKSAHYVIGYTKMFKNDLKFQAEVYFQDLWDLPVTVDSSRAWSLINGDPLNLEYVSEGKGRNYGIDLTLEKYFTHNFYYMVTGSLYSAKFRNLSGKWFNSRYNNSYMFKAVGGKEFKINENNTLGVNGRFIWTGGRRNTPVDPSKLTTDSYDFLDYSRYNELLLPPYIRLDIGASYRINKPSVSHTIAVDIQNVTNRKNIAARYYIPETDESYDTTLQGIIPVLSYRLDF